MSFPILRDVIKFTFDHDQWIRDQEAIEFRQMVEALAHTLRIAEIPTVKKMLEQSDELLLKLQKARRDWRSWLLIELNINELVRIDHGSKCINIPENPFGRFIPLQELIDWALGRDRPQVILVDGMAGMTVTTRHKYTMKLPGCEIYLGRLGEDGHKYKTAVILIEHLTSGIVKLKWNELVGKTERIVVERDGDTWKVDTGLPVTA